MPGRPLRARLRWEMGIIEFERRAGIADVIRGNPGGPDLERSWTVFQRLI